MCGVACYDAGGEKLVPVTHFAASDANAVGNIYGFNAVFLIWRYRIRVPGRILKVLIISGRGYAASLVYDLPFTSQDG
jgi:hypothetical protein